MPNRSNVVFLRFNFKDFKEDEISTSVACGANSFDLCEASLLIRFSLKDFKEEKRTSLHL